MENQKAENEKTETPPVEQPAAIVPATPPIPAELLSLGREPEQIITEAHRAAKALMEVVESKKSAVNINGELFLKFEDWQLLGRFFQLTSGVEGDAQYVEFGARKDKKFGFKATGYVLSAPTNQKITHAQSMCLSDEPRWVRKPLYQLASMSQTRAQAKAFRNVLSWVVVLAGFEPCPAEEMETNGQSNGPSVQPAQVVEMPQPKQNGKPAPVSVDPNNMVDALKASIQDAQKKKRQTQTSNSVRIKSARSVEELREIFKKLNQEEREQLMPLINERRAKLEVVCQ